MDPLPTPQLSGAAGRAEVLSAGAPAGASASRHGESDIGPATRRMLLKRIVWASREMAVVHFFTDASTYDSLMQLADDAEDLMRAGSYSEVALSAVRTRLCDACRRREAACGQCQRPPLQDCHWLDADLAAHRVPPRNVPAPRPPVSVRTDREPS